MPLKVLITGGGTGGHVFPAIAIADTIKAIRPDTEFLFVGASDKMEMEKVPEAGYKIVGLWISGFQRSLSLKNLAFPLKLISSLMKARGVLRGFRPDVVVGVGGFASGPVLKSAVWMNIPAVIQEQNSFAGITNRLVAKQVKRACVAYEGMERFFPKEVIVNTGNPVRKNMVSIEGKRNEALRNFGLEPDKPTILAVGGSLGARSINIALAAGIDQLLDKGYQVIWQTGKLFEEGAKHRERLSGRPVVITQFIKEMDLAYAAADIVVSRAGAIAVSELCIIGKPVVLVPFPHAAEDHQTKNAEALTQRDAALMIADSKVGDALVPTLLQLHGNDAQMQMLSKNLKQMAKPNAAVDIANEILKVAGH